MNTSPGPDLPKPSSVTPDDELPSSPAAPAAKAGGAPPLDPNGGEQNGSLFSRLWEKVFKPEEPDIRQNLDDMLAEALSAGYAGDLGADERTMIRNILHYHQVRVDDIMVPRADIIGFDQVGSFDDLIALFIEAAHSRIPVYEGTLDNVIGMVHIKDVVAPLTAKPNGQPKKSPKLSKLLRSVLYVPPSMRVIDLLARMRAARVHMAVVIDEYGGTDGLVTIEDVVEQIVGEIEDEHDLDQPDPLIQDGQGVWLVDARMSIEDLEVLVGLDLSDEEDEDMDVDTLGGLVFYLAGKVPAIGDHVSHEAGLLLEVIDGDPRRIKRVRVSHIPSASPPESE